MSEKGTEFTYEYESSEHIISHSSVDIISSVFQAARTKNVASDDSEQIPLFIFRKGISPLAAIIKYFHENQGLRFSEISSLLNRDQRTIWTEYNYTKKSVRFPSELVWSEKYFVVSNIFVNRTFSVLESLVLHLLNSNFSINDISGLLGKNPSTIRTAERRAKLKKKGGHKR